MLEVQGLRYAYKKNQVLKGVSFRAEAGECICVLGRNGAGKTTLFRCLLGFIKGYEGDINIDGLNAKQLLPREAAKKIAYIPQTHAPAFNYSVLETVLMGTSALIDKYRIPRRAEYEIAYQSMEQMHIAHLADRGCAELSGGERQLVLIARALAQKSKILVMDEPTANLDYGNQFHVMQQARELSENGYLVILSTHNPEHALLYADKALVLKDGGVAAYDDPELIVNPLMIKNIYGVSVEMQTRQTARGKRAVFSPNCSNNQSR